VTEAPVFAVVGRVNKGKSSVIATLAEDDSVRVDPRPGTTTECRRYPVTVDGRELFALVDTPGFEEADRALAWLEAVETPASARADRVRAFVAAFAGTGDFEEERRLLAPILDGAAVLYVVDGTRPYRKNYEAEMEVLRWAGQPGIALINRTGTGDHVAEWRRALDQYFKIVRVFDAFEVSFAERMRLLETFRELRPDWRGSIDAAIGALRADRQGRQSETAHAIADLLAFALSFTLDVDVPEGSAPSDERERLVRRFHDALRGRERDTRRAVEAIYRHSGLTWEASELAPPVWGQDLFAEATWKALGLTPGQLLALYTAAGAAVGGGLDAAVGGASLLAGTVLGALGGVGFWAWQAGQRMARATTASGIAGALRAGVHGSRRHRIGPHKHPNFPWVLLDRALLHYRAVLLRTHARRDAVRLDDAAPGQGVVSRLDDAERKAMERLFTRLRRGGAASAETVRTELAARVLALAARVSDEVEGQA
jgi:hypothetical protein